MALKLSWQCGTLVQHDRNDSKPVSGLGCSLWLRTGNRREFLSSAAVMSTGWLSEK